MTEERQPNTEPKTCCQERNELLRERKTVIGVVPILERERDEAIAKRDEFYATLKLAVERAEAAEKQLAEALAERDELAGQVNHDCAFHDEMASTNQIHNRFCGENGEPCQVCRLKAKREGK